MKVKELYIYWCFGVVDWLFRCHSALTSDKKNYIDKSQGTCRLPIRDSSC